MIIDRIEPEANSDFDLFSFAGRVTMVGGSGYALMKTLNEFKATSDFARSPYADPFKSKVVENLRKVESHYSNSQISASQSEAFATGKSKYSFGKSGNFGGPGLFRKQSIPFQNKEALNGFVDRLKAYTGTGKYDFDKNLGNYVQDIVDKYGMKRGFEMSASIRDDIIAQIDFKIGGKNVSVNPRSRAGQRYTGSGLNNLEMVGGILTGFSNETGEAIIESSASYQLKQIVANESNLFQLSSLRSEADKVAVYGKDKLAVAGSEGLNDLNLTELQRIQKSKVRPAPDLSVSNKAFENWAAANTFNIGGEKILSESLALLPDDSGANPVNRFIGQSESINASQLYRDVDVTYYDGPKLDSNFKWDEDILPDGKTVKRNTNLIKMKTLSITDPEMQRRFMREAQKQGVPLAGLADEEIIFNSKTAGVFTDKSRSMSIAGDKLSPFMESLLDSIGEKTGMSSEEITNSLMKEGGIEDKLKYADISLGDIYEKESRKLRTKMHQTDEMIKVNENLISLSKKSKGRHLAEKAQQAVAELESLRKEKQTLLQQQSELKNIGINPDGFRLERFNDKLKTSMVRGMYLNPKTGELKMSLHREFDFSDGIKIHSGEGAMKRYGAHSLDIERVLRNIGFSNVSGITGVSFADTLETSPQKMSRSAMQTIFSLAETAAETNNSAVLDVLSRYGIRRGRGLDSSKTSTANYRDVLRDVGFALGANNQDEAIQRAVNMAKLDIQGLGYVTTNVVGIEKHRFDMGAGGQATVSTRQMLNFQSLGLTDLIDDIKERRIDGGRAIFQAKELESMSQLVQDKKVTGLAVDDGLRKKLQSMYSGEFESVEELKATRSKVFNELDRAGMLQDGKLVLDLGKDLDNKKIVLSQSEFLDEFTGIQIGSKSEQKSLTDLDNIIKKLLASGMTVETKRIWANRYDEAISAIKKTVGKDLLRSKIQGSMYGKIESFKFGMEEYLQENKIKGNAVFMHESDIVRKFGKTGKDGKNILEQARRGELFGVFSREPAESIFSSMPARVLVAEEAAKVVGASLLKKEGLVYVNANDALLRSMFGDFDGDMAGIVPYLKRGSQMSDFVNMKKGTRAGKIGAIVREYQERLASGAQALKGRNSLSDLNMTPEERRLLNKKIAETGKGSIGIFSDKLASVHMALRSDFEKAGGLMEADISNVRKFIEAEASTHLLIENVLKAKYMSGSDLQQKRAEEIMDALTGEGAYSQASSQARRRTVESFFDDLVFGEHAEAYRKASSDQSDLLRALRDSGMTAEEMDAAMRFKKSFSSIGTLDYLVDMADAGKKLGSPKQYNENLMEMYYKGTDQDYVSSQIKKGIIDSNIEDAKRFSKGALKNFGLYALAPVAAIGLVGSMATDPIEMDIEREFSDGKEALRPNNGTVTQMRPRPKYRQAQVTGTMNSGSNQFLDLMNRSDSLNNIRLVNHMGNMDKYEIEEMIERGY